MSHLKILYDEPQEADWFRRLHPELADVEEAPITGSHPAAVEKVLSYDRPDIVLVDADHPILVVEETVEVPSGHNVGQRFARLAAAAECGVPCLYFGPYVAKKHGGVTAGPRFMNVRLFHALDAMVTATGTPVTTINWPVDHHHEVLRGHGKDGEVREYMDTFMGAYRTAGRAGVGKALLGSDIHQRLIEQRDEFVRTRIRRPEQYSEPPESVELLTRAQLIARAPAAARLAAAVQEVVLYNVGMTKIRSDPYTGMGMLYKYLYLTGRADRALVLWFPNVTLRAWSQAASNGTRKDVRLFRVAADAFLFADAFKLRGEA